MIRILSASVLLAGLLTLLSTADSFGQVLRHPPNAHAANCLADPEDSRWWGELFTTTEVEPVATDSVRVRFTLTNHCVTRLSVSGLEPATAPGARVVEDAAIQVAVISDGSAGGDPEFLVAGVGLLGIFDVPAGATVTREVVVQLTTGVATDVVAATAYSHSAFGGYVLVPDIGAVYGVGARSVCVHYSDRPCGAYQ